MIIPEFVWVQPTYTRRNFPYAPETTLSQTLTHFRPEIAHVEKLLKSSGKLLPEKFLANIKRIVLIIPSEVFCRIPFCCKLNNTEILYILLLPNIDLID